MNFKFTLESCLKSAHPQSCQICKPRRCLSPMLSQKPRGPSKSQILSNEQVTMNMGDFFFSSSPFWVCQDSWAPPSPWFPGTNRSKPFRKLQPSLSLLPEGCRACCVPGSLEKFCLWLLTTEASLRDGVTREAYSHRGSFLCFVCLITCLQLWALGFRVKRWGRRWSKEG